MIRVVLILLISLGLHSCKQEVTYRPPYIPIAFSVDTEGNISISSGQEFVTPLGTFGISASKEFALRKKEFILVLRNNKTGTDSVYKIEELQNAKIEIDGGKTTVRTQKRMVIIDITYAKHVTILPLSNNVAETQVACQGATPSKLFVGTKARVNTSWLNVRSEPRVPSEWASNILTSLPKNTVVEIIGGPQCAHNGYWWQVKTPQGIIGWMRETRPRSPFLIPTN